MARSHVDITSISTPTQENLDLLRPVPVSAFHLQISTESFAVIFDSELSLDVQVTEALSSCLEQPRQLYKVRSFLSPADLEKVIHVFIQSGRLKHTLFWYQREKRRQIPFD